MLVETLHLECPLDRLASAVERELTSAFARDRNDAAIELWREFAIDREFGFASRLTLIQARKIEKGIAYRPLDLERAVACEKDDRRMSVVAGYLCRGGKTISRRIAQQFEHGILHCGGRRLLHLQTISPRCTAAEARGRAGTAPLEAGTGTLLVSRTGRGEGLR